MATVVPATKLEDKQRKVYPFEVQLPRGTLTVDHESIVMPHQIRSVSAMRLLEKIGTLHDPEQQAQIENRMLEHLGISFEAEEAGSAQAFRPHSLLRPTRTEALQSSTIRIRLW